jgi:hypothetical protein
MSYTINLTNGTTLIPGGLSDGTVDTTHSSLTLIGRDYAGYGQFLNENFVYLLENFAATSGPSNPLRGQLWWDTANNILKVYSGRSWKISTGATSSPYSSPPVDLSAIGGDLWFDTTNTQLKVYSGSQWVTVGPVATPATGDTGATPALINDTSASPHVVIQFKISGVIYAIFSRDTFNTSLSGFSQINAGINFSSTASPTWKLSNQSVNNIAGTIVERDGTGSINVNSINADGTLTVGTIVASTITSPGSVGSFTGNLTGNVTGTYGTFSSIQTQGIIATSGYTGTILTASQPNITSLGTLTGLAVNGTTTLTGSTTLTGTATLNGQPILTSNGSFVASSINNTPIGNATPSTGAFTTLQVATSVTPLSNATINLGNTTNYFGTGYISTLNTTSLNVTSINPTTVTVSGSILPASNVAVDIGSTSSWFRNIYGTAIHAAYADLAERFHADAEYAPGTVVEMGGTAEITKVVAELSDKVFGVISTNAAYLMNSSAGNDATHPPIAMSGRVPVRVVGLIAKGDRLVSAGNGLARAGKQNELTPWNVIGRSLVNKTDTNESLIEAIVKINS